MLLITRKYQNNLLLLLFVLLAVLFDSCSDNMDDVSKEVTQNTPLNIPSAIPNNQISSDAYDWMKNHSGNVNAEHFKLQVNEKKSNSGSRYIDPGSVSISKADGALPSTWRLHKFSNSHGRFDTRGSNLWFKVQADDQPCCGQARPRTEMREVTKPSGSNTVKDAKWSTTAERTFQFRAKVTKLDGSANTVAIMQWFGENDDIMKIIVERESSTRAKVRADLAGTDYGSKYTLATVDIGSSADWFTVKVWVDDNQVERIDFDGVRKIEDKDYDSNSSGNEQDLDISNSGKQRTGNNSYFKYGAYLSTSKTNTSKQGKAEVEFDYVNMSNAQNY